MKCNLALGTSWSLQYVAWPRKSPFLCPFWFTPKTKKSVISSPDSGSDTKVLWMVVARKWLGTSIWIQAGFRMLSLSFFIALQCFIFLIFHEGVGALCIFTHFVIFLAVSCLASHIYFTSSCRKMAAQRDHQKSIHLPRMSSRGLKLVVKG